MGHLPVMNGILTKLLEALRKAWHWPRVNREAEWASIQQEYAERQAALLAQSRGLRLVDAVCGACYHGKSLHAKGKYFCKHDECRCYEFNP